MNKDLIKEIESFKDKTERELKIIEDYEAQFDHDLTMCKYIYDYHDKYGIGRNWSCDFSNDMIFNSITQMHIFDPETLIIPDKKFNFVHKKDVNPYNWHRMTWSSCLAHALPTPNALNYLKTLIGDKKVLSVGCGMALWEHMLINLHCKVYCYDTCIWAFTYTHVRKVQDDLEYLNKFIGVEFLFLGWPIPDENCDCCPDMCESCKSESFKPTKYRQYCKYGYDWDAIRAIKSKYVILLTDDGEWQCGCNYTVQSTKSRKLLHKRYKLVKNMQLPYNDDNDYWPYLKVWKIKI